MMGDLSKIPLEKLQQIHHAQVCIIRKREKLGLIEGKKIKAQNPGELFSKLSHLLKETFANAGKQPPGQLLGMQYYVSLLHALPLEKVKNLELETCKEIKKRKELYRQKIDAGNIEKAVNRELEDGA